MAFELIAMDAKNAENETNERLEIEGENTINDTMNTREDKLIIDEYRSSVENLWKGIVNLPKNWDKMTVQEQREWSYLQVNRHMTNMPKSLAFLVVGSSIRGDCGRSPSAPKPDWFDHEKMLRGQRFATKNLGAVCFAELMSLFGLFSFENSLKPIIITNQSSDPFTAFKRLLSTVTRVKNWFDSDPWIEGTKAYNDIQTVRKIHTIIRNKMINLSLEEIDRESKIAKAWSTSRSTLLDDFRGSCPAGAAGQRPYAFSKGEQYKRPKPMNQSEMAATQNGFVSLTILYPESFGIHGASDEDLEAFCHLWRSIGYLLGMEDEFNFCNGSLEEVKQRSRDFIEYWVKPNLRDITPEWEHMLRCAMAGIRLYFPYFPSWEHCTLYFAEVLDIRMPGLEASLSYWQRFRYILMKISIQWITRLPWGPAAINRTLALCMERSLAYSREELEILRKRSNIIMSEDIKGRDARQHTFASLTNWQKKPFFILFISSMLLSLPLVAKKIPGMFLLDAKTPLC